MSDRHLTVTSYAMTDLEYSGGVKLDGLGAVGDVQYKTGWPGGCLTADFTLDVPVDLVHEAVQLGRKLTISNEGGTVLWLGFIDKAQRGLPWRFSCLGLWSLGANYGMCECNDSTGDLKCDDNTGAGDDNFLLDPQCYLDCAASRGLPWMTCGYVEIDASTSTNCGRVYNGRNPPAPTTAKIPTVLIRGDTANPLAEVPWGRDAVDGDIHSLLAKVSAHTGFQFGVFEDGVVSAFEPINTEFVPATWLDPKWLVRHLDQPGGRTLDGVVTDFILRSRGSTAPPDPKMFTRTTRTVVHPAYIHETIPRREMVVDVTDLGTIQVADATAYAAALAKLAAQGPSSTEPVTVPYPHLLTAGGTVADPADVRPFDVVRLLGVSESPDTGSMDVNSIVDVVVAEIEYTAATDTVRITPASSAREDTRDLFRAAFSGGGLPTSGGGPPKLRAVIPSGRIRR